MPEQPLTNQPELTVSELSGALKRTVEDAFSYVRVRGEISGYKLAPSGHLYFSLKDEQSLINAVCWKGTTSRLPCTPEDGMEVICTGRVTTYAGRSQYQLIVESIEPAGVGALMALLEKRKQQLAQEGLFDPARKKPLPFLPEIIGVITSPTGAVIRDILHRLQDRFPRHVLLWPVLVQGDQAASQVANAIYGFNSLTKDSRVPRPDVIIVARGGGSLEDLWPFNEEIVVRAAAASEIPLISAVGHETDTTLIDYVSDRRAPTPTAAAEMAVPVRAELSMALRNTEQRIARIITRMQSEKEQRFDDMAERLYKALPTYLDKKHLALMSRSSKLQTPAHRISEAQNALALYSQRIQFALQQSVRKQEHRLQLITRGLTPHSLRKEIDLGEKQVQERYARLERSYHTICQRVEQRLQIATTLLESLHYKKVLQRGFAIVRDSAGQVVSSSAKAKESTRLQIEFADGEVATYTGEKPISARKKSSPNSGEGGQSSLF